MPASPSTAVTVEGQGSVSGEDLSSCDLPAPAQPSMGPEVALCHMGVFGLTTHVMRVTCVISTIETPLLLGRQKS